MSDSLLPPNRRTKRPSELPQPAGGEAAPARESAVQRAERKVRSKQARRQLFGRWFKRLQLLTGVIVVVATSVLVAWGLQRYLRSSPRFAIRIVEVEGNQRRRPLQLMKRSGVEVGVNIFMLDLDQARAALVADPWIERADVNKELPNKVSITVVEREARSLLSLDSKLYLIDANGEVFKELADGEPHDLPVMTGIEPEDLKRDREGVTIQIRRALELMADLTEAGIAKRYPLQEFRLNADGALDVVIGSEAAVLSMGSPPYRAKIDKAQRILAEMRQRNVKPAVVFLDNRAHPERVVVRMR